jgi:hypothetical protein
MIAKVFSVLIIATALLGQVTMRKPRAARPTPESVSLAAFLLTNCVVHEKCRPPLGGGLGPGVLGSEPRGKTCHAPNDSSLLLTNYPRPAARRRWGAQTVSLPRDLPLSCWPRAMWASAGPAMLAFTTSPLPAAPRAPASARPSVRLVVARRAGRYASPLLKTALPVVPTLPFSPSLHAPATCRASAPRARRGTRSRRAAVGPPPAAAAAAGRRPATTGRTPATIGRPGAAAGAAAGRSPTGECAGPMARHPVGASLPSP